LADEDLFQPSLSGSRNAPALYNSSGFFLAAFFAGPAAAGAYGVANSYRLGKLKSELPRILAVVAGCFLILVIASRQGWITALAELFDDRFSRAVQLAMRAMGLACFGTIYLMHRQHYRAASISGTDPLPGWVPGIAAVVVGLAANAAFLAWLKGHH
jgi:hypothetical protein